MVFWPDGCDFVTDAGDAIAPIDSGTVVLNVDTIGNGSFVTWVSNTPVAERANVLAQIAAGNNTTNVNAVNSHLNFTTYPITDMGRELVLLSIVGQLRNSSSVSALKTIIWSAAAVETCAITTPTDASDYVSELGCDDMIKARATEMLAYIEIANLRTAALNDLITIADSHPSAIVRQAAIDAYMFNMGDTPDAAARLGGFVDAADRPYIGRPRFYNGFDAGGFDLALAAFYDANPGELPEPTGYGPYDGGVTNNTCNPDW